MDIVRTFQTNGFTKDIVILGTPKEPLFRANDVAEILEMSNIRTVLSSYDSTKKVVREIDTPGGKQKTIFLTKKGLYKLLMQSRMPLAEQFQEWVYEVLDEIEKHGEYKIQQEMQEIKNELEAVKIQKENLEKELEEKVDGRPYIYIFDTKTTLPNNKSILKIGVSEHTHQRAKPYRQVAPNGTMAFRIQCSADNLKLTEKWIHSLLKPFRQAGEVFEMNFEFAKKWIIRVGNTVNLSCHLNHDEMEAKLSKIVDYENKILNQEYGFCATKEIETQTEDKYFVQPKEKPINNELNYKFDKYIEECCVLDTFHEVSAKDLEGQYRLWARCADKKTFHALLDYLQTRFKHIRLPNPNPNSKNVVYGYRGLKLKETTPFTLPFAPTDPENFLAHACIFSPSGKVIMNDLLEEYEKWGKSVEKTVDRADLKNYLKNSPRVLISNVWAASGNGQGYYGLSLKKEENINRTSSTAKTVTKRNEDGEVIATWTTIAKAAQDEGFPAAKLSRAIKNETVLNGFRYISS